MVKSFSIHPKLAAVADLILNVIFVWLLMQVPSWLFVGVWFFFRIAIWALLLWLMYYPSELSRWKHLLSLFVFTVGSVCFLLFIEWQPAWYMFGFIFIFFTFMSFWLLPASNVSLTSFLKPHLRWRFIMSVIGLAGILEGINAAIAFQLVYVSVWVWLVAAAVLSTAVAVWWWLEYGIERNKKLLALACVWFGMMLEFLWVMQILPLGYLVSSLVLVWCWYVLWLLARFSLTKEGINWKKQMWFLGINAVLFASFLIFAVKWK